MQWNPESGLKAKNFPPSENPGSLRLNEAFSMTLANTAAAPALHFRFHFQAFCALQNIPEQGFLLYPSCKRWLLPQAKK